MAVYRKRSTTSAPEALSSSYLMGSPPIGTSMMTLTSSGTFLPTGIWSMRMAGPDCNAGVVILLLTAVNHGGQVPDETPRPGLRRPNPALCTVSISRPAPRIVGVFMQTKAFAAQSATTPMAPYSVDRREPGP